VPSVDADLFDAVAAGRSEKRDAWGPSSWWTGVDEEEVPTASTAARPAKQGRVSETTTYDWTNDRDVFAVPEFTPPPGVLLK
jgi:hypothetical protein